MKIECKFDVDYVALFSNVGSIKENEFFLLMTYHKSKKGGFGKFISVGDCKRLLRKKNKNYVYRESPIVFLKKSKKRICDKEYQLFLG